MYLHKPSFVTGLVVGGAARGDLFPKSDPGPVWARWGYSQPRRRSSSVRFVIYVMLALLVFLTAIVLSNQP